MARVCGGEDALRGVELDGVLMAAEDIDRIAADAHRAGAMAHSRAHFGSVVNEGERRKVVIGYGVRIQFTDPLRSRLCK